MKNFNRNVCLNNIHYFMKKKDIKVQDLEKGADVSKGYISRLSAEGNHTVPSIDVISSFADILGVTIDALLKYDFSKFTDTEQSVLQFINKLVIDTESFQQEWKRNEYEKDVYKLKNNFQSISFQVPEELFVQQSRYVPSGGDYPDTVEGTIFQSKFHQKTNTKIEDDVFCTRIAKRVYLYLFTSTFGKNVDPFDQKEDPDNWIDNALNYHKDYELYILNDGVLEGICNATLDESDKNTIFSDPLEHLYRSAKETSSHTQIADETKDIINKFLNGAFSPDDSNANKKGQ